MNRLEVDLPEEVSLEKARLILAIELQRNGYISRGRAAEIAGLPILEYINEMTQHGLPYFDYDPGELQRDLQNLSK